MTGAGADIDYDRLIADYEQGLVDRLRGFEAGDAPFLQLWVPDEDPVRSLCNILDAAATEGEAAVAIAIGADTAASLDADALRAAASEYGAVTLDANGAGYRLVVTGLKTPAHRQLPGIRRTTVLRPLAEPIADAAAPAAKSSEDGIGEHYAAAVAAAAEVLDHAGDPGEAAGLVRVEGDDAAARLVLLVDPANHTVRRAGHWGATDPVDGALLDRLCALIEGQPLQEASDHGVIRLERALRDPAAGRPLAGVVTPIAADPRFARPQRLIRASFADYRRKTGYTAIANEHDSGPSTEWRALTDSERLQRLRKATTEIAAENGLPADEIEVVAIEIGVRVVVRFHGSLAAGDRQHHMLVLEAGIKQKVDARLELYQVELKDTNVIRRLSDAGESR